MTPAGLLSEALALIDLLVLVRAQRFVGFYISSYSWVVQASSRHFQASNCLRQTPSGLTTSSCFVCMAACFEHPLISNDSPVFASAFGVQVLGVDCQPFA